MKPTMLELLIETHVGLEWLGPASRETTEKALGYLSNLDEMSEVLDLGCGTGGPTMVLAQHIAGNITGVDFCPDFIDVFNRNAKKLNLDKRVKGVVGSMEKLDFPKNSFDLIWSEGAIDAIGFEKGMKYWNGFLKKGGHVAVTCPSWLTNERPAEVEKFWADAGVVLDTIEDNTLIMQRAGYDVAMTFALSEDCWTVNYFIPRGIAEETLLKKYPGNKIVESYIKNEKREIELYSRYKGYYGYVFYIGKKL